MARSLLGAAFLFAVVSAGSGCMQQARVVKFDKETGMGVVAIPENTDTWPTYYRSAAMDKIKENAPYYANTEILSEGEVVIGQETQNNQRVENRKLGKDGKPVGDLTTSVATTTTTDKKEYQIEFRIRPTTLGAGNSIVPAGGIPKTNHELGPTGKPLNEQSKVDPRLGEPVSRFNNYGTGQR